MDKVDFHLDALRVAEVLDGAHNVSVHRQSENAPHLPRDAPLPPDAPLAHGAFRIVDRLEAQTEPRHDGIIVVADPHRLHDLDSVVASDQCRFAAAEHPVSRNGRRHRRVAFVATPRYHLQVGVEDARRVQQSLAAESGFGRPAIHPAGISAGLNAAGPAPGDAVVVVVVVAVVVVVVVVAVVAVVVLETTNGMRPHRAHERAGHDSAIRPNAPGSRARREPLEAHDSVRSIAIGPLGMREVNGLANESQIVTEAHVDVNPHVVGSGHGLEQRGVVARLGRTASQHTSAECVEACIRHPDSLVEILLADLVKDSGDDIPELSLGLLSSEGTATTPARPSSRIRTSIAAATVVSPSRRRERSEHAESVGCLPDGRQVGAVQPCRVRFRLDGTQRKARCQTGGGLELDVSRQVRYREPRADARTLMTMRRVPYDLACLDPA